MAALCLQLTQPATDRASESAGPCSIRPGASNGVVVRRALPVRRVGVNSDGQRCPVIRHSDQNGAVLLIDAANVVGSRPTGWWRDRAGAARAFVDQVRDAAGWGRLPMPVVVVLEGKARDGVETGVADGVTVLHAAGSGDDTLIDVTRDASEEVTLVTADR